MSLAAKLRSFLRNLFSTHRVDADLDSEVHSHLAMLIDQNLRAGMSPEEAQRAARMELGGIEQVKEQVRDRRMGNWLHSVLFDFRFGVRQLRKNPGFTAVAILTLALGIGATTAIFGVVDAVILRPLPYNSPDGLVLVKERIPKVTPDPITVCAPDVVRFQRENHSFVSLAAFRGDQFDLAAGTEPQRVHVDRANVNLFSLLGAQPILGRVFAPEEDQPGHAVAILSYGLWQREFAGAPDIVGRSVSLNRQIYTVIGVMPATFIFPLSGMEQGDAADLFIPMAFTHDELANEADNFDYSVVGRLLPGVSLAQANADMQVIAHRIQETYPPEFRSDFNLEAVVLPLRDMVIGKSRTLLLLLFGAVAFVFLICCINIANLLLCRSTDRQKEIAVRLSLGASRGRLLRQLAAESMLLTLTGAALGLAFAFWITNALLGLMPSDIPLIHGVGLNPAVLGFTLGLAVIVGLLFGIVPAFASSRTKVVDSLKEGGRSTTQGPQLHRLRGALVILEVTLAMVLLVGAGLLLRSFQRMLETQPGFRPEHVLTASLSLREPHYKDDSDIRNFYQRLLERLQNLPGVQIAGASSDLPLKAGWNHLFTPDGYQPPPGASLNLCNHSVILGRYLQAIGAPLLRGRYFTDQDNSASTHVLIISDSLARRYWPSQDPIGKRLKWGPEGSKDPWLTVVGVVGDVKQSSLDVETSPHTYEPFLQNPISALNVALRTSNDPASMATALRAAVWSIDPQLAVAQVQTMDQVIRKSTTPRRFSLFLLGGFASLALILSAIGIYGVIAYSVVRRVHEMGIRIALGAQRRDVLRLVIGQGMLLLAVGMIIGTLGALALTRALASFLYGIRPTDPVTFVAVVAILAGVAFLACYIPARRATRVDPMIALRYE
jgi:putative ABC transport system permease protein